MSEAALSNRIRARRGEIGLSQQALAELVGVSRQAIIAIEGGRQVPSTSLGLRLAHALRCALEDLFSLGSSGALTALIAPMPSERRGQRSGEETRVLVGKVGDRWVAHRVPPDPTLAADGWIAASSTAGTVLVHPFSDVAHLRRNVIVTGCAPLLGALAQRVTRRFGDARATWIHGGSHRALDLLEGGFVHVAGIHLSREISGEDNVGAVRSRFQGQRMLVVNLTRWRQGLVLPPGNPLAIRDAADLLRPGLRIVRREEGAAAQKLLHTVLVREGVDRPTIFGPLATGHAEVAQLVRCGAADVGIAIESVALAAGLGFVPLTEERFDLVVAAATAEEAPVSRLLAALDDPAFKAEMAHLPGCEAELTGHVTSVEAV